ncbi:MULTISPECIES: helix-turn-helix domain-containing protein [unclassified Sphingobacterium]|uniref:helix-turn-helix domain-containing protein n=1 Tax=unclassified Sphingobacterium TaxID=2609468 RepID=UPI0026012556|nr:MULTISPECIES: response regulator transcription factor [unclassified Sphingobacterium]
MEQVERINSVGEYNKLAGVDTLHPLVNVINFSKVPSTRHFKRYMGLYTMFLKEVKCGNMTYGCQPYDYEDGTLVFVSPGQVYGIDNSIVQKPSGYALVFHPDLLNGTLLAATIKKYTFFSYEVNEALHLSLKERKTIVDCLQKIATEIDQNIDKHSQTLIVSNIEVLLNYCMRFYDRQFITRNKVNTDLLIRFEKFLHEYFNSDKPQFLGVPGVAYCADQLNLSPNYFGDLIKKETGSTALDYIQSKVIGEAKLKLFDSTKAISEISHELGFRYQQHFTRLFKQKTGMTPNEYRNLN